MMLLSLFACPRTSDIDVPTAPPLPPTPICGVSTDLLDAPDPIESPAGLLSAIDLLAIDADAVLEGTTVFIDAEATFLVGDQGGRPTFELGPDSLVELDGEVVDLERVQVSDPPRDVVVLPPLDPCTEHTLRVSHLLDETWMVEPGSQTRIQPLDDGMWWAAGLEDDAPGKFLGMWMMGNLLFDRFDLRLAIDASALESPHQLVATGEDAGEWTRQWRNIQSHTPFWAVSPASQTRSLVHPVVLSDQTVSLEIHALDFGNADLENARDRAEAALQDFDALFGAYHHGDRYLVWIRNDQGSSMEYDGATLTEVGAIEHEVLHSWFARGASPVSDREGWVDEAMTSWVTDLFPLRAIPIDYTSEPLVLRIGEDDWAGASLSVDQYVFGSSIFADVAFMHSVDEVIEAMGVFYRDRAGASYRSVEIEEHLTCWFDDDGVRDAFRHRAYGGGPVGPRPAEWCLTVSGP